MAIATNRHLSSAKGTFSLIAKAKLKYYYAVFLRSEILFVFFQKITAVPANRNALIRYKTIDKCLQNRYRKWTLDDLVEACSEALYEFEGIDKGVSVRTVQGDIQVMRSDRLGYNAPIIVKEMKYYTYEDKDYSITNIPLTEQDLGHLMDAVSFMKQFQGFSHFRLLDGMVQKLEDHIYASQSSKEAVIDFEKNEGLKGLEYLNPLYQSIVKQEALSLTYQSFKARQANTFIYFPYLLKEWRNRWFLVGAKRGFKDITYLALDRIQAVETSNVVFEERTQFDGASYFKHAIGVTAAPTVPVEEVELYVARKHAPYIETKPLHHSQQTISRDYYGIVIRLELQHNYELEKEILAFGDGIKVIKPPRLKRNIQERLSAAVDWYQTELNEKGLLSTKRQFVHKGYAVLQHVYTKRAIKKIRSILSKSGITISTPHLLNHLPDLKQLVQCQNIERVAQLALGGAVIKSVNYHRQLQEVMATWQQQPEQDISCFVYLQDHNDRYGALEILPGSQRKKHSAQEIKTITENSLPSLLKVYEGGIALLHPLLLCGHNKPFTNRIMDVIEIVYTSPSSLEGEV